MMEKFCRSELITLKAVPFAAAFLFVIFVIIAETGVLQNKVFARDKGITICDFENEQDIKMWALKIHSRDEKPSVEEARLDHETGTAASGEGAMKVVKVFSLPSHEAITFEMEVDIPIGDPSKGGLEFSINPGELDLKNDYELTIRIVDDIGEVWNYRWWSTSAFLMKGWNEVSIGLTEFEFVWGGNGDDGEDGLIDGRKIKLIWFEFSDEVNLGIGKDRPVTATFYLDEIKYIPEMEHKSQGRSPPSTSEKREVRKTDVIMSSTNLPEISYFESENDSKRWISNSGVKLELSGEHVTQGERSAKLTFPVPSPPEKQTQIISLKYPSYSSRDWSQYGMLVIDFYNPNDFTVRLLLEIPGLAALHFEMPPSRQFILRGSLLTPIDFLNAEDSYPIDNAKELILSTNFFSPNPADSPNIIPKGDRVTVFIDNVRLLTKKETQDYIEKVCPIEPESARKVSERKFPPLSANEISRFQSLSIFWMDRNNITDESEKLAFTREFATGRVIASHGLNLAVGKPESVDKLREYDVVVFDDIDSSAFTREQLETVRKYYEGGGTVVMLGGWASFGGHGVSSGHNENTGYKDTPIEEILPVELLPPPDDCSGGMELKVIKPEHVVMKNIPWDEMPVRWYNVVIPKPGSEVLAVDGNIKNKITPVVAVGERSLVFTSVDCRGGSAMLKWEPWERFIIQGLNYLTREREILVRKDKKEVDIELRKLPVSEEVYVKLERSPTPAFENGSLSCKTILRNATWELLTFDLQINLTREDVFLKELFSSGISVNPGEEKRIDHSFGLTGIEKGLYKVIATISKNGKTIGEATQTIRIYPEYVPILERDFVFMPLSHSSWADELVIEPLFEELGFLKSGYGPVMMWYPESSFTRVNYGGYGIDLKSTVAPQFKHFVEREMPFLVGTFSGWEAGQPLDIRLERSRKVTEWADEIGGEYFLGVRWGESDGIAYYFKTVQEKTNRIERANAYIKLVKELRERTGVPPGKLLITYPSIFFNYGMDFEAGVDVINRVTPGQWNNLEINVAQLRGASRSFNGTHYGMGTATDPASHVPSYYDKKSGRYDGIKKMDYSWKWSQEDIFKFWLHNYYNGGGYLDPYYQPPLADGKPTEYTETILRFLDFIDTNPRTKDIVTKTAIVRSKGDLWGGTHGIKLEDNPHGQKAQGFGNWVPGGIPFKEEADFNYLNVFFPNFSEDCIYTKSLWTGTPFGAVDIIYPSIKLRNMERYDSIIFLGFHRMDSVREDFFIDLARYVELGGIALLSADQLKNSKDKFYSGKGVSRILGAAILDSKAALSDSFEIKDETFLDLEKRSYPLKSRVKLNGENEPWVYRVKIDGAKVIAEDNQGTPLLVMNHYGRGHIFLFTSPTISIIPPVGRNQFVKEVISKIATHKGMPVSISPASENVEFLISKTGEKRAQIFLMNHGPENWEGDVIVDIRSAGLSRVMDTSVVAKAFNGYEKVYEPQLKIERTKGMLVIKGMSLKGDTENSYAYRQANFILVEMGEGFR